MFWIKEVYYRSQLCKYILDPSHVIQSYDVQIIDDLTYETSPLQIEDRKVKHLSGKESLLVEVVWGGTVDGSVI